MVSEFSLEALNPGLATTLSSRIAASRRAQALDAIFGSLQSKLGAELRDLKKEQASIIWVLKWFTSKGYVRREWVKGRERDLELTLRELVSFISTTAVIPDEKGAEVKPSMLLLSHLSLAERGQLAYILEPLIHDTRILEIASARQGNGRVAVVSRYPGGAVAVTPVIDKLMEWNAPIGITAITDDKALEIIAKKYQKASDRTPPGEFFALDHVSAVGGADVLILDAASGDELSIFMAAQFLSAQGKKHPKIVTVHDSYTSLLKIYQRLQAWGLPMPDRITVMDEAQKSIIATAFPDLASRIEVTGQPAFDVTPEKKQETRKRVRAELGILDHETLVTVELRDDPNPGETEAMAKALGEAKGRGRIVVAVRRHPRDVYKTYEEYAEMFEKSGVRVVHTIVRYPGPDGTAAVRLASDMTLGTAYTGGMQATATGIPAIHVLDRKFGIFNRKATVFDLPTADVGAAVRIDHVEDLARVVDDLMDPSSELSVSVKANMEKHYRPDGKNTDRVANLILSLLPKRENDAGSAV